MNSDSVNRLCDAVAKLKASMAEADFDCNLGVPETEESIQFIEDRLGVKFPDDYRYFLKQYGTGEELIPTFEAFGLQSMLKEYEVMIADWGDFESTTIETQGPVKAVFRNSLWWPIAVQSHEFIFLDLDPPSGGTRGQVIYGMDNNPERFVIACSFSGLVELVAAFFEIWNASDEDDYDEFFDENFHDKVITHHPAT